MAHKVSVPAVDPATVCNSLGYTGEPEVCALLEITLPTLRNRLSAGTAPPSYKIGNRRLFKVSELDAWIRRHRVQRAAA